MIGKLLGSGGRLSSGHPSKASDRTRRKTTARLLRAGTDLHEVIETPKVLWQQAIRRIRARSASRT